LNLVATGQACGGDLIRVHYDRSCDCMTFFMEAESTPFTVMAEMVDPYTLMIPVAMIPVATIPAQAAVRPPRVVTARSSRR
jgi:hypothetical protein